MSVRIRIDQVSKSFRIPVGAPLTLKQRVLHPLQRTEWRAFQALRDVTFQVEDGEFFGIVGRNGCGKSTLLKLLSGIYHPDGGSLDVRGSVAPLIELGVGFNHELSARDNVFINGTLLGLTAAQLRRKFDEIVEFAELDGFMDLKLRNFSSGMVVRLAFAVAIHASADILLVDEVLAVGDERFQQKCFEVFRQRRASGQTVVFVSHDMNAVQQFCQRAILLDQGRLVHEGDPFSVTRAYHQVNAGADAVSSESSEMQGAELLELRTTTADAPHDQQDVLPQRARVEVRARLRFHEPAADPSVALTIRDGLGSFALRANTAWGGDAATIGAVQAGEEREVVFSFDNHLGAGRYSIRLGVADAGAVGALGAWDHAGSFEVTADVQTLGICDVPVTVSINA